MAHAREIPKRECIMCGKNAQVEVFNTYNASFGFYCRLCGRKRVAELVKIEKRQ